MCEVPPPGSDPHQRKLREQKLEEEQDLVDKLLDKSGCADLHFKVQECMVEHRDWRKCQAIVKEFQQCINKSKVNRTAGPQFLMDAVTAQMYSPEETSSKSDERNDWMDLLSSPGYTLLAGMLCGIVAHQFSRLFIRGASTTPPAVSSFTSSLADLTSGMSYKMVLIVRTDLGMQKGKMAAQCAHAALSVYKKALKSHPEWVASWERIGQAKICLKTDSEESLLGLAAKSRELKLPWAIVRDAGKTQVEAGTLTVLGIGPAPAKAIDEVSSHLKLY